MQRRPRVLVFLKNTSKQEVVGGQSVAGQGSLDPLAESLRLAHEAHREAIATLEGILLGLAVETTFAWLTDKVDARGYDLVIALGGDGTVLHASHQIGDTPILPINSAPRYSVGYLTSVTIDEAREPIVEALEGRLGTTKLQRMAIDIDGRRVYGRVLNDVLYSHQCPARTARYSIRLGDIEENQMSSGIWVGPAAGSTAAQHAAGGRILPPRSKKIQFVVREPYSRTGDRYRLVKGLVSPGERLVLRSAMDSAVLYVDGPHVTLNVRLGEVVAFYLSNEPLHLLGFRRPGRRQGARDGSGRPQSPSSSRSEEPPSVRVEDLGRL